MSEREIRDFASRINLDFTECFQRIQFHTSSMNPALGARGCRTAVVWPEIIEMQTRAIMGMGMINTRLFIIACSCWSWFVCGEASSDVESYASYGVKH